jgi:hypothetical protein
MTHKVASSRLSQTSNSIFSGNLSPESGTNMLSQNVGNQLLVGSVQHTRKSLTSNTLQQSLKSGSLKVCYELLNFEPIFQDSNLAM